ncbi:MAG: aminotransferase class III-fold pyridoxal phosphate-dependent enzyme [Chloroflexi bacterium]|nr:aminotransferase class III-fold pyridoxal phosphate-dependent enzyme [Chloroflexota bacterium]
METKNRRLTKSIKYLERAKKIIPAGTQTFSKGPTQYVQGIAPIYLQKGKGSHIFDVDGNEYIDYPMALGPITLGYCYPAVDKAIIAQLQDGITFSLMHPLEIDLAELLIDTIPCAEMVRFGKNGSDVTSGAVRLARAYTNRDKIACCGYHGWHDWYVGTTSRNRGVPQVTRELTLTFQYNNIESLHRLFTDNKDQIACVIMEPISVTEPSEDFLAEVKELTHRNGSILIFDEIVTGFRLALGGAQEYYGIIPDLSTAGKGMANGMPISALAGKEEVMRHLGELFFSFTFGGEVLSLAAAIATIKEMDQKQVSRHFWHQGKKLKNGYNALAQEFGLSDRTFCEGLDAHAAIRFRDSDGKDSLEMKSLFQQETIKRGILFNGIHNFCYSHSDDDIQVTLDAYRDAMVILKKAIEENALEEYLEGTAVQPVFRPL